MKRQALAPDQFEAVARLISMKDGASRDAARMVLVEGERGSEAARRVGIGRAAVGQAVRRALDAHALCLAGAGVADLPTIDPASIQWARTALDNRGAGQARLTMSIALARQLVALAEACAHLTGPAGEPAEATDAEG